MKFESSSIDDNSFTLKFSGRELREVDPFIDVLMETEEDVEDDCFSLNEDVEGFDCSVWSRDSASLVPGGVAVKFSCDNFGTENCAATYIEPDELGVEVSVKVSK